MSLSSRTGQVVFLQNGGSTSCYLMASIGDLFQNYAGSADAPTDIYPDFTQVQPTVSAIFTSSKQASGYVTPNAVDWSFNGTAITFNDDGVSTNTFGGETGHFKRVVPAAGKNDYYGLQIVKNLVKAAGAAPCRIQAAGSFVESAGSRTVRGDVTVPITLRVGDSNTVTIRPADSNYATITVSGGSCKLKAVAVVGNSEVTTGLSYEWGLLQGNGSWKALEETGAVLTVTADMVNTNAIVRVVVKQNGKPFGQDEATVMDLSDPYDILPNPTPSDETISDDDVNRTTVVYRPKLVQRGSTTAVNENMKFFMVFRDASGNVLNTATANTAGKEFTCTLAMCKQAGNAGPVYLITTEV